MFSDAKKGIGWRVCGVLDEGMGHLPDFFCRWRGGDAAERGGGLSLVPRQAVTLLHDKVTKTCAWGYRPLRTPLSGAYESATLISRLVRLLA